MKRYSLTFLCSKIFSESDPWWFCMKIEKDGIKNISSSTPPNKSEIIKFCHVVLHNCCVVSEFSAKVFIISCSQSYHCAIGHFTQCNHLIFVHNQYHRLNNCQYINQLCLNDLKNGHGLTVIHFPPTHHLHENYFGVKRKGRQNNTLVYSCPIAFFNPVCQCG